METEERKKIESGEVRVLKLSQLVQNTGQIPGLPANPRSIQREKFELLKENIRQHPEFLGYNTLKVFPWKDGKYVVIGGNMRHKALKELGYKELPCSVIDPSTPVEDLKAYTILDNSAFGQWDWDMIANEWDETEITDWGVDLPKDWGDIDLNQGERDEDAELERKKKEFEERMAAGKISEEDEEYQEFLRKFELKKTTDDCYTPQNVYEAVAKWVATEYGVKEAAFVRPFYPGGNYEEESYPKGCVVVDNPPFSILSEILKFYKSKGIKFFLFAPALTLFSSSSSSCTALPIGVDLTYVNGAVVHTSFLTNLELPSIRLRSAPSLYAVVKKANDENLKSTIRALPKYIYDKHVIMAMFVSTLSRYGIDFAVPVSESEPIRQLDAQKESKKGLYGSGYLVSDRVAAEREKAEREKAEREKPEIWSLSEREMAIVEKLNGAKK